MSFDLIVIGAGINGAGIARDAAMRGLKVLLLDKGDVGGGTTSWSTRLVHGGLRYLEHGELGLVRESLRERERLLRNAPHLVKPLPMLVPIYERGERGPLKIRAGMVVYDLLSFDKTLERHRMLSRGETLRRAAGLSAEGLQGAALYYDAQVEYPERLALENVLSAREHGAEIKTYAYVTRLEVKARRVRSVEYKDLIEGTTHHVSAQVFVNVAGPWVDEVLKETTGGSGTSRRLIGGTKGSHIVTRKFEGAPRDALYVEAQADGRPFFIIPWNDLYLIGTTDIRFEGDLDSVEADEDEIEYLLNETNRVIPEAHLARDSVLYTYSGVRPLPFRADETVNARLTRRHFIHDHAPEIENLLSVVGGKITTYRNLSEQTVNLVFKKLRRTLQPPATREAKLPGASNFHSFAESFMRDERLTELSKKHLLRVYGTRAREVLEMAEDDTTLLETLDEETGALCVELLFSFRKEMARTLADSLLRRTMTGTGASAGLNALEKAVGVARRYLAWDEARAQRETEAYREYLRRFHPRAAA